MRKIRIFRWQISSQSEISEGKSKEFILRFLIVSALYYIILKTKGLIPQKLYEDPLNTKNPTSPPYEKYV
ncbi:MAG: hypothetical protein ACTSYD_13550 [Candidatus Heimdallarchaeaceae archaeon]